MEKRPDFYTKILKVIGILIERKRKKEQSPSKSLLGLYWELEVKYNGKSFKAPALCPICERNDLV